jgi:hypothetical protein
MRPGLIGIAFGNAFDRTSLWSVEADTPNIDLTSFGESTSVSGSRSGSLFLMACLPSPL